MDDPGLDLDAFKRFDVVALKAYLRKRGLSMVGRKEVLVARAFAAYEAKVPILHTKQQADVIRESEYKKLLLQDNGSALPDPFDDLTDGWLNEAEGHKYWPPCAIQDISYFFSKSDVYNKVSLGKRLLNDYKEQKAYSYFSSEFLYEIYYNSVSKESEFCFLRSKCTPSMRLRNVPHEVWVCVNKLNGDIKSAYCTCFAGLNQTCNHVAAVLFKVDHVLKTGQISNKDQLSCTSRLCTWVEPKVSKVPEAEPISNMFVSKPRFDKGPALKGGLNDVKRKLFCPSRNERGMTQQEFLQRLEDISPNSVTLGERLPTRNKVYLEHDKTCPDDSQVPESVEKMALKSSSVADLLRNIQSLTAQELTKVEMCTRNQGGRVWAEQRRGRVTASKFHRIHTRMLTYKSDNTIDMSAAIKEVLQYSVPGDLPALKYGRRMENSAAKTYLDHMKSMGHKNVQITECGLFVCSEKQYIGASPDRIALCDCCGKHVVEIKCPISCAKCAPSDENTECLTAINGIVRLKKTHQYHTQVQGQMAVAKIHSAHFFVYSPYGYHIEEITFESQFWDMVFSNLIMFFETFIAHELITREIKQGNCSVDLNNNGVKRTGTVLEKPKKQVKKTKENQSKGKQKAIKPAPVYLCGTCKTRCEYTTSKSTWDECSICCNTCRLWHHMTCVGLNKDSPEVTNKHMKYLCPECKKS